MIAVLLILVLASEIHSEECWWSGCQPKSWAERGCFPGDTWEINITQSCPGGDKYYCCRNISLGDPGTGPGDCFVTFDEFKRAVVVNGYIAPIKNQYDAMCRQVKVGNIASKQELAMLFAHAIHATGGFIHKKELACINTGCPGQYDSSVGTPGRNYYGRGYIQLSHSYNYLAASVALYNDMRLIKNPDLVSGDEDTSWSTAFWFWKDRVRTDPKVRRYWYGSSTRKINGGLECDGNAKDAARKSFQIYTKVLKAFSITAKAIEKGCY